jgi:hypothetical protein
MVVITEACRFGEFPIQAGSTWLLHACLPSEESNDKVYFHPTGLKSMIKKIK